MVVCDVIMVVIFDQRCSELLAEAKGINNQRCETVEGWSGVKSLHISTQLQINCCLKALHHRLWTVPMTDDMQQERRDATTRKLNSQKSPPHTASAPDFTTLVLTSSTSIDQSSIVLASRARLLASHVVQTGIFVQNIALPLAM